MSEGLKQKLLDLKRFRILTNIESSISKGEKITRKDYVETVKLPDVVALLDEFAESPELLEKLAELEHDQWIKWSKAIAPEINTAYYMPHLERWRKCWVPYSKLSESDKEHDREWARKVLAVLEGEKK